MAYPPRYTRHSNFLQFLQAGGTFDQTFMAAMDAELNDISSSIDQQISRWQAITSAAGMLTGVPSTIAASLAGTQSITVGTLGQTVFPTTIVWDSSFTASQIIAIRIAVGSTTGEAFDPANYSVADNGGYLQVTLTTSPMAVGDKLLVQAFSAGAGVLAVLGSRTNGQGASKVALEDVDALFTTKQVEGALKEFRQAYNAFVAGLGTTANLWYKTGLTAGGGATAATGDWAMGSHKITGLADGVSAQDAATVAQVLAATQGLLNLTSYFLRKDVAIPWEADQDANSHKLANLIMSDTLGAVAAQAANKTYVDGKIAEQIAPINTTLAALGSPGSVGKRLATFQTPGSGVGYSWTVPAGVTAALVEIWGAGGGSSASHSPAGSGAYTQVALTLATGDIVSFAVGAGAVNTSGQDSVCYVNGSEVARAGGGNKNLGAKATGSITISSKVSGGFTIPGSNGTTDRDGVDDGGTAPRGGSGGHYQPEYSSTAGTAPGGGGCQGGTGAGGWAIITY